MFFRIALLLITFGFAFETFAEDSGKAARQTPHNLARQSEREEGLDMDHALSEIDG